MTCSWERRYGGLAFLGSSGRDSGRFRTSHFSGINFIEQIIIISDVGFSLFEIILQERFFLYMLFLFFDDFLDCCFDLNEIFFQTVRLFPETLALFVGPLAQVVGLLASGFLKFFEAFFFGAFYGPNLRSFDRSGNRFFRDLGSVAWLFPF